MSRIWVWGAATGLVAAAMPGPRSALKATLVLGDVLRPPADGRLSRRGRRVAVSRIELPHGVADLYEPRPGSPGIVFVHGANPGGIDDVRVQRLARALAGAGRSVVAPALTLADRRLDLDDLQRVRDAIDWLADRSGPVVVVAFSFGGAMTLCALAERPSIQARIRRVATVGTYYDLVHLISGVTAGAVATRGSLYQWRPPAAAGDIAPLVAEFLSGDDAGAVVTALHSGDPAALVGEQRAVYELIANTDATRTEDLVHALPDGVRSLIERMSPARSIGAIRVPILALHSRNDPAAPAIESVELVEATRRRARSRLTLVGSFQHVTPAGDLAGWVRDGPALVRYATAILRPGERWLPGRSTT